MFVGDYMTRDLTTVCETEPLSAADDIALEMSVHQLPVLDESGRLVGIITDRDIRSAVGYDQTLSEKLQVQEVMTANPITVEPVDSLTNVLRQFCEHRFGALPVVLHGKLVGIITRHDLLVAMSAMLGLDRSGCSIEVALPSGPKDLADAFRSLRNFNGDLHSAVVSRMRTDGDEPSLYLRVGRLDGEIVENGLRKAGLILLGAEKADRKES